MDGPPAEPTNDLAWISDDAGRPTTPAGSPNWRAVLLVVAVFAGLLGMYVLGQAGGRQLQAAPDVAPTAAPVATPTVDSQPAIEPEAGPLPLDLLGDGEILNVFDLGDDERVVLFCRDPNSRSGLPPTLAMVHLRSDATLGDQLIGYDELARLRTTTCERCAGESVDLAGEPILFGSCPHGIPGGFGVAYAIAVPTNGARSPLALDLTCGITSLRVDGDRLVVDAEAPMTRGLMQARFALPSVSFERVDGRFVADDLELLHWNCDLGGSAQLAQRHVLREDAPRSISYERVDSAIGVLGVHGQLVIGLEPEQCQMLTGAWWDRPEREQGTGEVIASLIGIPPPPGLRDWYYTCHLG